MIITGVEKDPELLQFKAQCLGSLLFFIKRFFKLLEGKEFVLYPSMQGENHCITICRQLTDIFYLKKKCLIINIPHGHFKSTILSYFVPWAFAHYPDCQFLYVSHTLDLAAKHTANIKNIMEMYEYKSLFGVSISKKSSAKDDFETTGRGVVKAFGSDGAITGYNAGFAGQERFTGCLLMDDLHKIQDVHSDTMRKKVIDNYQNAFKQRVRAPNVPLVAIGQRLHEDDIFSFFKSGVDGHSWERIILPAEDDEGRILCPYLTPRAMLDNEREHNPYYYHAQLLQNPQPASGSLFLKEYFIRLNDEPDIKLGFITADTAETDKTYNDATVFSFWGLYKVQNFGKDTGEWGLHWLDCMEIRIEPADLESAFMSFYARCSTYKIPPLFSAIEKKSTGVTLTSVLRRLRGISILEIERNSNSGSKINRFLATQPYVNKKLISLPDRASHTDMCIDHMSRITANNTHKHDDIADTLCDAVRIGLIENTLKSRVNVNLPEKQIFDSFNSHLNRVNKARQAVWN